MRDGVFRIALIHALEQSVLPIRRAFEAHWPEAFRFDLLDTSLAVDLAEAGRLEDSMIRRFVALGDHAAYSEGKAGRTDAILFTCSAFGPAIDAVKARLPIPVLRPNEAAFEAALGHGGRIGLLVTFGPSLPALTAELEEMARARGASVEVFPTLAEGALTALQAGDAETHDRLAAEAAARLPELDALVLGQFSLARAAPLIRASRDAPVLTTPESAALGLRAMLEGRT